MENYRNTLLTSEEYIKSFTSISENLAGDYILSGVFTAQEEFLQTIISSALYFKLQELIYNSEIEEPENAKYKYLLDNYIQQYLAFRTVADVLPLINWKISNFGLHKDTDENIVAASESEFDSVRKYYIYKSDFYCRRLQKYLLAHKDDFPELKDCSIEFFKKNLTSAASTGIWLGGFRGRIIF